MVDISSQNNKINVTVSSSSNISNVNATPDYTKYYSDKSKEWAISDKIVDNTDYSSKYYANESKKQADISTAKTTEVIESGNTAVTNIESARDNAITDITNQENVSVDNVNTAGATQIALATEQANIATQQATIATSKTTEVVASGNEALSNIDTAKNNAITSITNQETTSKTSLIDEGATQIGLIQNEGATQVNLATEQATIATSQASIATSKTTEVVESGNTALSNIETAKSNALNDINTTGAEYVNNAEQYAQNALNSANNAKTSEDNALSYKNSAMESSQTATEQASIAVTNANKAITSATNAKTSETNAKSSETRCEEILSRLGTAIKIKGRVNSLGDLPLSGNLDGDTYLVGSEGLDSYPEYYWYQDHWEFLGTSGTTLSWGLITGDITAQTDLQTVLDSKQDVIPDLATIRSGASKGATALQSYTETDPVYTADKPNLALKSDIPDVSNLATKDEIPTVPTNVSAFVNDAGYLTEHQDISGKANTDLSNLSNVGKKVIDGQWVSKTQTLSTATAVGTYTIDLSSYLPNDNYNYIVQFYGYWLSSNSSDGSSVHISSSFYPKSMLISRCNSSVSTAKMPIFELYIPKNDRELTYTVEIKSLSSRSHIDAIAYRRIGTNQ